MKNLKGGDEKTSWTKNEQGQNKSNSARPRECMNSGHFTSKNQSDWSCFQPKTVEKKKESQTDEYEDVEKEIQLENK